ncbi:MAG: TRAP transporter small permease [Rhizobiaceae bacterium]|nr:TRAP transporter small permease [Roseitalea sp.]MBO6728075.1 TRAP transporter small permease [Rhizobiaceae bacterium]
MTILSSLSRIVALVEIAVAALLTVATTGLILLNIVTRTSGNALYWVDEAAISTMVWASFLGASAAIERRSAVAVTLLPDAMPERWRYRLRLWSDFLVLVFFAILMWLCFLWFDPLTLYRADFSLSDFTSETFNFIYQETTTTLGVPKFWLWGVMPVFAVFGTLHALARLLERGLASQEAPEPEADHTETLR